MNILLIGAFGFDNMDTGGQPVKSRELYYALQNDKRVENVSILETKNWKKHPFKLLFSFFKKAKKSDLIIMLPAHNGLFVFSFLLCFAKKRFKKKIYYDVIGGWLVEKAKQHHSLIKRLKKFDDIWVETSSMKNGLQKLGIQSRVVPNFKSLKPIAFDEVPDDYTPPLKLCFFARVMKQKGVQIAIDTIIRLNKEGFRYSLDIYGYIDPLYREEFDNLLLNSKGFISYKGVAKPNESVAILKNYYLLLFPTLFYTEGVPGTLVDALFAGVPVVSSKWQNFYDVVDENITGFGYDFNDSNGLFCILKEMYSNHNKIREMRFECIKKSSRFTPKNALSLIDL